MPQRLSKRQQWFEQQHEEPQLLQPQDCSQQQLFSQPQLCSQQPQPQPPWNMPNRPSNRKQLFWQQQPEPQLLQPQDCSQQQLFSHPQPQLLLAQQLGSQ